MSKAKQATNFETSLYILKYFLFYLFFIMLLKLLMIGTALSFSMSILYFYEQAELGNTTIENADLISNLISRYVDATAKTLLFCALVVSVIVIYQHYLAKKTTKIKKPLWMRLKEKAYEDRMRML